MNLQPDQLICRDKYRLIRFLGKGGYGEVWLAEERASRSQKAIKIAHQNAEAWQRFNRELQLSSQLDHANLVVTHTVEPDGDTSFMVMPYMTGGSLAEKLKQGPLPLLEAVQIAAQIAAGLGHLHRKDWVHRDVHPGNILFNGEGVARLSDFGLVQTPETSVSLWYGGQTERHPGNVYYQPPEAIGQAGRPLAPLYAASDVYMLGAVLWEMVTGKSYYHHKNKPLEDLRPDIPDWLRELLRQCLSLEVEKRPFDGTILANQLNQMLTQYLHTLTQPIEQAIERSAWDEVEKNLQKLEGFTGQPANELRQRSDEKRRQEQIEKDNQVKQKDLLTEQINQAINSQLWTEAKTALRELEIITGENSSDLREKLKNAQKEQEVDRRLRLIAWNPIDWLRLLWWLLVTPRDYKRHRKVYGTKSMSDTGAWLGMALNQLAFSLFLMLSVAEAYKLPQEGDLILLTSNWGWLLLAIGLYPVLGAPIKNVVVVDILSFVFFIGFALLSILISAANANSITFIFAFVIAISAGTMIFLFSEDSFDEWNFPRIAPFSATGGVTAVWVFGPIAKAAAFIATDYIFALNFEGIIAAFALIVAAILGFVITGITVFVVLSSIPFGIVGIVSRIVWGNINNDRSSWWALLLLVVVYGFMVWQVVAAWLA